MLGLCRACHDEISAARTKDDNTLSELAWTVSG
jgi:hypothetical protein